MRTLSKSDFKLASDCATKLYYKELGYPQKEDDNPYLAMLAEGGYMVEQLARLRYPDGITLEYGRDAVADARATLDALLYGAERHDPALVAGYRTLLKRYCKLDTLAMVLVWDSWRRMGTGAIE